MVIWEALTLLTTAILGGMKSVLGITLWKGKEISFFQVWCDKWMYGLSAVWLLFYGVIWIGFGKSLAVIRHSDLLCTYVILAFIDAKRMIVSNKILICYFAGQMLFGALSLTPEKLLHISLTGIVFAAVLFVFVWIFGKKMGMGDIKLLGITAMTAGWKYTMQTLILAMGLSFLYSISLLWIKKKNMQTQFPFVPFLAIGIGIQIIF